MAVFLFVYIVVYSAMNGYGYIRLLPLLPDRRPLRLSVAFFFMLMVPGPIFVRVLEHAGWERGLPPAAFLIFSWMGFLFLFVFISAAFDLLRVLLWSIRRLLSRRVSWRLPSPCYLAKASVFLSVLLFCYGIFEAQNIQQEQVVIPTTKLPAGMEKLRIVQVSDVHLGLLMDTKRLERIIRLIQEAEPDILVSTGDLVDSSPENLMEQIEVWKTVSAPLGKFAVTGNHEFYVGLENAISLTSQAGFTILDDAVTKAGPITVIGLGDLSSFPLQKSQETAKILHLSKKERDRFTLLLKHRPGARPFYPEQVSLQLSGHTHQGQIFPFVYLTRLAFPYPGGLSRDNGGWLYISRGSGTWGPPIRILSPPEVTIIDLVSESFAIPQSPMD